MESSTKLGIFFFLLQAKYLNSDDTEFATSCKGNITHIDYAAHFDDILLFLVGGRGDERIEALFDYWNTNVFPSLAALNKFESAPYSHIPTDNSAIHTVRAVDRMLSKLRKN